MRSLSLERLQEFGQRGVSVFALKPVDLKKKKSTTVSLKCGWCKKPIKRRKYELRKAKHNSYCSRECVGKWKSQNLIGKNSPAWMGGHKYETKYPEKHRAHMAIKNVRRRKGFVRPNCSRCGSKKAEAHHPDYSKLLKVIWLCRGCHTKEHYHRHGKA